MNFFKSVFQDDPDPPGTESESDSPKHSEEHEQPEQSNPEDDGGWSFGGLMKTLATRSESVIETYRRDLEEFGTGLKKEIEVAQGSLGTVGHAIDELGNTVLKGTADIIAQGKEAILAAGNDESDSSDNNSSQSFGRRDSFSSKPYSRFDAQIRVVQGDLNTYCEEPEDSDDYKKWESGFALDEKAEEMEKLFEDNGDMKGVYKRAVPNTVDHETFWFRYFYKVHKLKQAEDLRANLVKRAISLEDEEELSWDIDDEDESSEKDVEATKEVSRLKLEGNDGIMGSGDVSETVKDEVRNAGSVAKVSTQQDEVAEVSNVALKTDKDNEEKKETSNEEVPEAKPVVAVAAAAPPASDEAAPIKDSVKPKSDEAAPSQEPTKPDVVCASSAQQPSEEDLGWDEIEDMSSIDGKEVNRSGGSPNRNELCKRLSAAEDDEDLSWDIEDDDDESSSTKA
ncbi:PREDICTED: BSD domain-containing protein 1-like [Camelina sativa]|uniref:BSD domain-containing protein 1-like n=1 Tax=Camelina sativa TaxID=90675 RepID=A0ABM0WR29_CAMSA|nr:PREDICTED: BSD domain-containing protein 1-like [Camelina sativa]